MEYGNSTISQRARHSLFQCNYCLVVWNEHIKSVSDPPRCSFHVCERSTCAGHCLAWRVFTDCWSPSWRSFLKVIEQSSKCVFCIRFIQFMTLRCWILSHNASILPTNTVISIKRTCNLKIMTIAEKVTQVYNRTWSTECTARKPIPNAPYSFSHCMSAQLKPNVGDQKYPGQ